MKIKNNNRILSKEIIKQITDVYYDYPNRKFTLSGFHIPIHLNNYSNAQQEKRLQWLAQRQKELITGKEITEEDYRTELFDSTGGYILEDVLLKKIKDINKNKINKFLDKQKNQNSFDQVSKKILNDFIGRYKEITISSDKHKNIKLHALFFNENKDLSIRIDGYKIDYFVIDTENYKSNSIKIIKERKLKSGSSFEFPDFAVYFNGLPFIVVEMKQLFLNGINGTHAALKDYRNKESYHNFLACIGTNGIDAFISSVPNSSSFFKWLNYKGLKDYIGYYDENDENGFFDLISELITSPKNMLFYFESCTMVSECGTYLKSARIQQYMTAKKVYETMNKNPDGFKNYFQHHTRTGKSFTFKIIAKMAYKKLNNQYKKAIFFTHDVNSVMPSVKREFSNLEFPAGSIKRIDSKKEYKEILGSDQIFGLYIVNMQIIQQSKEPIDESSGVLIFIDEVHTHQKITNDYSIKSTMADFRKFHFPNATVISATASPLYEEYKNKEGDIELRDITSEIYGDCIDQFTASDAVKLDLVTKLNYEKINYTSSGLNVLLQRVGEIEEEEEEAVLLNLISNIEILKEKNKNETIRLKEIPNEVVKKYMEISITEYNYNRVVALNPYKKADPYREFMSVLLHDLQVVINNDLNLIRRKIKPQFKKRIWQATLREKIENIVIPDVLKQRNAQPKFMPKFFYVVNPRDDQNQITNGEILLSVVKQMIQEYIAETPNYDPKLFNQKNNVYKGVRFGFDSSESEGGSDYNGELRGYPDITSLFEVDEVEKKDIHIKPVDVLILVRKKLMGYDNKNLTTVFLDKEIDESNIKEMLQLSTRGTTKREGKDLGYIKDLTFSDRNVNTFRKAFSIYDKKEGIKEFLFDEEEIEKATYNLKENINELIGLISNEKKFKEKNKSSLLEDPIIFDIINFVKNQYWQWRSDENRQRKYFIEKYISIISKIEKSYKSLISPQFILEKRNEEELFNKVISVFQINAALLKDIKNKRKTIYKKLYTSEDILNILESTFESFGGLSSFIEQMDFKYKGTSLITISESQQWGTSKKRIVDSIGKIHKDLNKLQSSHLSGKFREELEQISLYVDSENDENIENQQEKINKLTKKIENLKLEKQIRIEDEFNGNEKIYEIVYNFEKDFTSEYYDCLIACANEWDILIQKTINSIELSRTKSEKTLEIINNFSFRLPENIDSENPLYKKFGKIYKKIFSGEDSIIAKEEDKLRMDLENEIHIDDIQLTNNKILNILLRYLDNE